jgi:VIT1/CCC1 family predicted Fe2+/Mn2+ transporter
MTMTEECKNEIREAIQHEIREEIREAIQHEIREEIRKGFREMYAEQGFTIAQHMADHAFAKEIRTAAKTIKTTSYITITATIVAAILGLVWCAITGKI